MTDFTQILQDEDDKDIEDTIATQNNGWAKICAERARDGEPLPDVPVLTLGGAISRALGSIYQDEPNVPYDEKWTRGELAVRCKRATDITLTAEETALAKKMVAKMYGSLVTFRVASLLDPADQPNQKIKPKMRAVK